MKTGGLVDRRTGGRVLLILGGALLLAGALRAQDPVRARLEARGLPADLVDQVTAIAAEATAQGLPADPLAGKAIEGFAKQVPPARIVAAVREYGNRMQQGRDAVRGAGIAAPTSEVITAAADAMGRGLRNEEINSMVRAARGPDRLSSGLTVAAALTAQGMPPQRAVAVVNAAMQNGRSSSQILDLPSSAQAMQLQGLTPDQAGERLMRGGFGGGPGSGSGSSGQGGMRDGFGGQGGGDDHHGGMGGEGGRGPGPGAGGTPPPPRPPGGERPGGNRGPGSGGDRPQQP